MDDIGRSGADNMALDERLLVDALRYGIRYVRLYRWDPPTLSIGRNQPVDELIPDVPWVRRPTGGQAVWHEHEVTYAVAAPIGAFGSLRKAYCEIHERLARALRLLGADAVLAPARGPARRPARQASCFAAAVGGEILVNGRKLVGSAQVRKRNAFLQHGSILLDGSQQHLPADGGGTTLSAVLGRIITFDEVVSAVNSAWGEPLEPATRQPARPVVASIAPQ